MDDETNEVEVDLEQRQRQGSTGYAMRRHSQLLRRRNTQPTILSNVESTDDDDDDDTESPDPEAPLEEQSGEDEEDEDREDVDEGTVKADEYEPSEADSVESFTLKVCNDTGTCVFSGC